MDSAAQAKELERIFNGLEKPHGGQRKREMRTAFVEAFQTGKYCNFRIVRPKKGETLIEETPTRKILYRWSGKGGVGHSALAASPKDVEATVTSEESVNQESQEVLEAVA